MTPQTLTAEAVIERALKSGFRYMISDFRNDHKGTRFFKELDETTEAGHWLPADVPAAIWVVKNALASGATFKELFND